MTFDSIESSIEDGQPVEVFEIAGAGAPFFYTSAEDSVTLGATVYTPVAGLQRGTIAEDPENRQADFELTLPTSNPAARIFTGFLPGVRVRLTVRKFHRTDLPTPEVVEVFDGFIQSAQFSRNGKECTLIARNELAAAGKQIPERTFQFACNHVLYDPLTCRVDDSNPAFRAASLPVVSQVGNVLTVSGLGFVDGFADGGFVEVVGLSDFRFIESQVGQAITLLIPFSVQPIAVNVFAGCKHDPATCVVKFANYINYGGFPFVSKEDPHRTGIQ